ncbi:MAG: ABC transporter ATP-binding protein [Lentisphaeria bacterium]
MDDKKAIFDSAAWRYFTGFFRQQSLRVVLSSLGAAAQSLLVLPILYLVRYLFDVAIPQNDIRLIVWAGAGIFGFRVVNSALSLWLRGVNITIINTAIFKLREDLLHKLYSFSRAFHTQADQKVIQARIVQDSERLGTMSNTLLSRIFPALLTSVSLCLILLVLNWVLVLVMLALFPVVFLVNRHTMKIVKARTYRFQRAFESFSKGVWFVLRYMDLTRIQAAEAREMARQAATMQELREQTGRMSFIYAVHAQVQQTLTGLSGILILVIGGASMVHSRMTIGEFLSFYVAAMYLYGQVDVITASLTDLVSGNESLATLHELAGTRDLQPYRGTKRIAFQGGIRLEAVSFAYDRQPVLTAASLDIRPGSRVAVIGANGAGKSTAIELILGFYAPHQGRLYADGVPYEELDQTELRRAIGVVMQNPPLFSGTILENLAYGIPDADRDRIAWACQVALADDFIRQLPAGYDTQIGDDGILLSGGERQRLAIARALLRRPRLLILDEPTNHLDHDTVSRLMNRLDHLEEHPAILLVSHDRGVVAHAPEVYELDKGTLRRVSPASTF